MKGWLRASAVPVRRASGEALARLCSAAPAVQATQGRNCFARSTYRGRELLALTGPVAPGRQELWQRGSIAALGTINLLKSHTLVSAQTARPSA